MFNGCTPETIAISIVITARSLSSIDENPYIEQMFGR